MQPIEPPKAPLQFSTINQEEKDEMRKNKNKREGRKKQRKMNPL